jgi:hypothetical protein
MDIYYIVQSDICLMLPRKIEAFVCNNCNDYKLELQIATVLFSFSHAAVLIVTWLLDVTNIQSRYEVLKILNIVLFSITVKLHCKATFTVSCYPVFIYYGALRTYRFR